MKKLLIAPFAFFLAGLLQAQAPQSMSYQAILRDAGGTAQTNTAGTLGLDILQGSSSGPVVYSENHTVTSNDFGLVNVAIGAGTVISGSMSGIDWGTGPYFVRTTLNGTTMGTSELLSVPYALYAGQAAGSTGGWGLTGNEGTVDGTNFIGTTDDTPLTFKVDGQKVGRIENMANENAFIGFEAGNEIATGIGNSGFGSWALRFHTTGNYNTAMGRQALMANTTGSSNTAIGSLSLRSNTTGSGSTAVGIYALENNTTGMDNTAIGTQALKTNSTGSDNTAVGKNALQLNTTGYSNTALGVDALMVNTSGYRNTAIGSIALRALTTGSENTAVGYNALGELTIGTDNVGVGKWALLQTTTGSSNTALGVVALAGNTTSSGNTAIGNGAIQIGPVGNDNTAVGNGAMQNAGGGDFNTATGHEALVLQSGSYNSAFGTRALSFNFLAGNYNTGLGYDADVDAANRSNTIVIGGNSNLALNGSNRVRIGNSSMSSIGGQVNWTALSDERVKTQVRSDVSGLDFISRLQPVTYNYSIDATAKVEGKVDTTDWNGKRDIEQMRFSGFLAQQVERAANDANYDFSGVDRPADGDGLWGLRYAEFTVPLVKAVQELSTITQEQQKLIERLEKRIAELEERN